MTEQAFGINATFSTLPMGVFFSLVCAWFQSRVLLFYCLFSNLPTYGPMDLMILF